MKVGLNGFGNLPVKEVPALGGSHAYRFGKVKVGLFEQLFGFFRIVFILMIHFKITEYLGRNRAVHGFGRAKQDLLDDRFFVHGVIKGLADFFVGGHPFLVIHAHEDRSGVQRHFDSYSRIGLESGNV